MKQNTIIKVTDAYTKKTILLGCNNFIKISAEKNATIGTICTKIESIGAMVTVSWVIESVEEIEKLINN